MIGGLPSAPVAAATAESAIGPGATVQRGVRLRALLVQPLALLTALVVCAGLLLLSGHNPLTVYQALWSGAVTGPSALADTLVAATPYIFLGLAVALGFKGGLFNIGAEGQYIMGGVGAVWAGHLFNGAPAVLLLPFALLVGALAGLLYASIAGVLKVFSGAHEVITTIMLNNIAGFLVSWLVDQGGIMHGSGEIQQSYYVNPGAQLPIIAPGTALHAGLLLALVVAGLLYVLIWRTTWGFQLRAIGLNPTAARSAGISLRRMTISTMAVSGALAGLAGAVQISGLVHVLQDPFGSGFGFDAIAVAIIGAGHPIGIVLAALLLGGLHNGQTVMEASAGISGPFVYVIQSTILFFVAAPMVIRWLYFRWWRPVRARRGVA